MWKYFEKGKRLLRYLLTAAALLLAAELAVAAPEARVLAGADAFAAEGSSIMVYQAETQTAKGYFRALLLERYWQEYEMDVSEQTGPAWTACSGLYDITLHRFSPAEGTVSVQQDRRCLDWLRVGLAALFVSAAACEGAGWLLRRAKRKK